MTEYFSTLANDVESSVVDFPSLNRSGLMWEVGLALTARTEPQFPAAATLSTPDGNVGVITVAGGPHLPIAALRTSPTLGLRPPRRQPATRLNPGSWTLALWRRDRDLSFAPAHFLGTAPVKCGERIVDELVANVTWTGEMAGGGVFDLDENLVAIIVPCAERFVAVTTDGIADLLREAQSLEGRLVGRFGLGLEPPTETEQRFFGQSEGLLVREVWTESLSDLAGIFPGDILVAIDGTPVTSMDQLETIAAITEVESFDLNVLRRGETVNIHLATNAPVIEGPALPPDAEGLMWKPPPTGLLVEQVTPGSRVDDAGIQSGDRLLRVDGVEIDDADQLRAALSSERQDPVFVEAQRHNRRWGVLLP